jgi:hypothetical protein
MLIRNMMMKLTKRLLEKVKPQTKADSELNPTLQCPAPTCGNALLCVRFFSVTGFTKG